MLTDFNSVLTEAMRAIDDGRIDDGVTLLDTVPDSPVGMDTRVWIGVALKKMRLLLRFNDRQLSRMTSIVDEILVADVVQFNDAVGSQRWLAAEIFVKFLFIKYPYDAFTNVESLPLRNFVKDNFNGLSTEPVIVFDAEELVSKFEQEPDTHFTELLTKMTPERVQVLRTDPALLAKVNRLLTQFETSNQMLAARINGVVNLIGPYPE